MRAIILYGGSRKLSRIAEGLAEGLRSASFEVDVREAELHPQGAVGLGPYDLVCVGSSIKGVWNPEISPAIDATAKRFSRLEGKPVAAFVQRKIFASGKALRRLMAVLERQGAFVMDFAALSHPREAAEFARRLQRIVHD